MLMNWVNGTDLNDWANRLDSRSKLPQLIRRLVYATTDKPRKVDFPSEEAIQLAGWDGLTELAEVHPYVPTGYSGWELSAKHDVKRKADEDFQKRTTNPGTLDPRKSSFVFTTLRRWGGKDVWVQARKAENLWSDVRAYDADDIEQWLELAPAVAAWLAEVIGKHPPEAQSLVGFWEDFSSTTNPAIPKNLLVAGRAAEAKQTIDWLAGPPAVFSLAGDSPSEAVAFLAAALLALPNEGSEHFISRSIVSGDIHVLRQIASNSKPLIVSWLADDESTVGAAVARGHHVFIPSRYGQPGSLSRNNPTVVPLPRIPSDKFIEAMVCAGLAKTTAESLSRESSRSVLVLQRRISAAGRPAVPNWATPEVAHELIPILLAGSWIGSNPCDQDTLRELAGIADYGQVEQKAGRWAQESDAPVRRLGEEWSLVAPLDAWHLLSRSLTHQDLERFSTVVEKVLSVADPTLELPREDRWLSGVLKQSPANSYSLRSGITQSLCLLATVAQQIGVAAGHQPQQYVDRLVWSLLGGSPGLKRWYSLSRLLPLLAEASPEFFLRALEDELVLESPEIIQLFGEEGWLGHSAHTGLLWALETLAWFPAYLGRVTIVLGKLARLDPGGTLANRPAKSLRDIFLTWHPQTGATPEQRKQALDLLLPKIPDVSWRLLIDLLPKGHDFASPTSRPRWREAPEVKPTTWRDHYANVGPVIDQAIAVADSDPVKLNQLIPEMATFPPSRRALLLDGLGQCACEGSESAEKFQLWESLREFVGRHRRFAGADWTLPEEELVKIDPVVARLQPQSRTKQFEWLFSDWHPSMALQGNTIQEMDAEIEAARGEALAVIYSAEGVEGLCSIARSSKYPAFVGSAAAVLSTARTFDDAFLKTALGADDAKLRVAGVAFAHRSIRTLGLDWATNTMKTISAHLNSTGKADLFLAMPACNATWELVASSGSEVEGIYWSQLQTFEILSDDPDEMSRGVIGLLQHKRSFDALSVVSHRACSLPSALLLRVLDDMAEQLNSERKPSINAITGYEVEQILSALVFRKDVEESELIRQEWFYLPFLGYGQTKNAPTLHSHIARNPDFFAELIRLSFRPAQGAEQSAVENAISESDLQRARNAYSAISSLRTIPGTQDDGSVDAAKLNAWVDRARELNSQNDRGGIGDQQIGGILAWSPPGDDHIWPSHAVRDLIERVESRNIEIGFQVGTENKRGVTTRGLLDGGCQERALVQTYSNWADACAIRWPRTSAVLRSISDSYERQAQLEDEDAQRWDLRT